MIDFFIAPVRRLPLILLFLLLIAIPQTGNAACQVTLQWDVNNPAPEGYQVFGRTADESYDYDEPWWQGDQTFAQCSIDGLDENETYFFVVRAVQGDDSSGDSNEVRYAYLDDPASDDSASLTDNTTASSPGGGSGAGCFIQSLGRFN